MDRFRLSFPSGHSSFSAYTMIYLAVSYLKYAYTYFVKYNVTISFSDLLAAKNYMER